MLECRHFRAHWSRFRFKELEEAEGLRMRRHLESCRRCQKYSQQMQAIVDCLKGMGKAGQNELESVRVERLLENACQRHRIAARGRQAMAATLLAGFIGGALFWAALDEVKHEPAYPIISHTQTISLPIAGVKNISLAIDSDRVLQEVTFTIELPEGVELDGYPGQRQLSWQGPLHAGLNRLTLPLLTNHQAHEGVLKARIEYAGGGRELVLPLRPSEGSAGLRATQEILSEDNIQAGTWRYLS
ncbi:MAG TPA: hypothetical protein VFX02_06995 [Gammaproteobacteria bacterium]|nr:hypothetical protein [Gammaproteobacteria bacterium]